MYKFFYMCSLKFITGTEIGNGIKKEWRMRMRLELIHQKGFVLWEDEIVLKRNGERTLTILQFLLQSNLFYDRFTAKCSFLLLFGISLFFD